MSGSYRIAQGQLRADTEEQEVFAIEYSIRTNIRPMFCDWETSEKQKTIVNVNIRPLDGRIPADGLYYLEDNGNTLFRLKKSGGEWHVLCPGCLPKSGLAAAHGGADPQNHCRSGGCPHSCLHNSRTYCIS